MMVFGIGTQSDNALGSAKVLTVDASGNLTTTYGGQTYSGSYIDSGTNGIFFLDRRRPGCRCARTTRDFYCPTTLQTQSATIRGVNGDDAAL